MKVGNSSLEYFDVYQRSARALAVYPPQHEAAYLALGLTGEAGEVANKIKKVLRGDHGDGPIPDKVRNDILFELGDTLWYLAVLADALGFDLSEVASANINKLVKRRDSNLLKGEGDVREATVQG